ncbi:MAG: 4-hydroxy 2-oxovalerate aldolase [Actinomycetota bacterium]|jgi:4-hydroxy 2-oxovalerate aldolase|nr:4-hydroxy-2-oxovalerate aldolase [Cryptosporangiaceae bacterium]MDQ1676727.1 4-hydroxy 2-oxovalerate aldolase [Actinomycetota bacterium]
MLSSSQVTPLRDTRLLDVTIRDGGYVNRHSWTREQALRLAAASAEAGVRCIEIGYFRPARHAVDGDAAPAASCPPDYLEALRNKLPEATTLVAMVHAKDVSLAHYRQLADLGVGFVRLPTKASAAGHVGEHVEAIRAAGMQAAVNVIRVSEVATDDVIAVAAVAEQAGVNVLYVADSNGSLFPEQVTELIRTVRAATSTPLGFHAHDGLSLAFSNSLAAAREGARYLDASLGGLGKGGGNLSMELIAGYLRSRAGASYDITPLARATADVLAPWKGGNSLAECESIVSGLLDLNIDDIQKVQKESADQLIPLLNRSASAVEASLSS